MPGTSPHLESLLRELAPQVLGVLVRRYRAFDDAEDAVQEALVSAASAWPASGVPDSPRAWLVTAASRRLIDGFRSDGARRDREAAFAADAVPTGPAVTAGDHDDSLELLVLCCHPALTPPSQIALTLRAVGGLTTAEIAASLLVPEATVAQRISRAKAAIRRAGSTFGLPDDPSERIAAVAAVLYLVFTEGHAATAGESLYRVDLTAEAIRLARMLLAAAEADARLEAERDELRGLLALMLLTDARRPARLDPAGALVPLDRQDRARWDRALLDEGRALVVRALREGPVGPYQLQAAIAAAHADAVDAADTDWVEIVALYDLLRRVAPGPAVELNRVAALAFRDGPAAGLRELDDLDAAGALAGHPRVGAVRAHLLERLGDPGAADAFRAAALRTSSAPEQRYLLGRAADLDAP